MSYTITNINKNYKGEEIVYIKDDETEREETLTKAELKMMMGKGLIEISNYILDSEGRLRPSFLSKGKVDHTPCVPLTDEQQRYVMQYGLVHFFKASYLTTTQRKGLEGKDCKPMKTVMEILLHTPTEKCKEYNMIWFYINDEHGRDVGLNEIKNHKASHRASTIEEMCAAVWYPTLNEARELRYRPQGKATHLYPDYKAPAIITIGNIPAERLEIMTATEYLEKMTLPTEKDFVSIVNQLFTIHQMIYTICTKDCDKLGYTPEKGTQFYFIGEEKHPCRVKPADLHKDFMKDVKLANKLGLRPACKIYWAGCTDTIVALNIFCYYDFVTGMFYLGTHYDNSENYEKTYPTLDKLVRYIHKDALVSPTHNVAFKSLNDIKNYLHIFIDYLAY